VIIPQKETAARSIALSNKDDLLKWQKE